jgi:lipoic acid synthetase
MILGEICTRGCRFCNISKGTPAPVDPQEPHKVARAVAELGLKHAVITSVTRDDLESGGARQFAQLTHEIRTLSPDCRIELLIPDLQGKREALEMVLAARPDILGHNLETVPRLYEHVRFGASYYRSLQVLADCREIYPQVCSKSSLMLGMGESICEVLDVLKDLRRVGCQILTLGQYLAPTKDHYPADRFLHPKEFDLLRKMAQELGFKHVESGPLVRTSYHAGQQVS